MAPSRKPLVEFYCHWQWQPGHISFFFIHVLPSCLCNVKCFYPQEPIIFKRCSCRPPSFRSCEAPRSCWNADVETWEGCESGRLIPSTLEIRAAAADLGAHALVTTHAVQYFLVSVPAAGGPLIASLCTLW